MSDTFRRFYAISLGASFLLVGSIIAISGTVSLIIRMPIALVADKYGLRIPILLGLLFTAIPPAIFIFANDPLVLLEAQVIDGFGASFFLSQMYSFITRRFTSSDSNSGKVREFTGYLVSGMTFFRLNLSGDCICNT